MTINTKKNPSSEDKLLLPNFITPVTGRRVKPEGKFKIPSYTELPKVRGIFKNIEMPGTGFSFPCRFWKGSPMTFTLMDGCEYVIPRVVAEHLNENCAYKQMEWISQDGVISSGKPITGGGSGIQVIGKDFSKRVKSKQYRFMFQILGDA